jgi:methylmalonyl-CoA mutase N-terminal domain/subunit
VDPFAGSYAIESMTDEIEAAARTLMDSVEDLGGAVAAIERGFQKAEIENAAYHVAREIDEGERIVVGVNKFATTGEEPYEPLRFDPAIEENQAERLARLKERRDKASSARTIDALRDVWGEDQPGELYSLSNSGPGGRSWLSSGILPAARRWASNGRCSSSTPRAGCCARRRASCSPTCR